MCTIRVQYQFHTKKPYRCCSIQSHTSFGGMEAILRRYRLHLRQELGPRQNDSICIYTLHRVPERHFLLIVFGVKQATCSILGGELTNSTNKVLFSIFHRWRHEFYFMYNVSQVERDENVIYEVYYFWVPVFCAWVNLSNKETLFFCKTDWNILYINNIKWNPEYFNYISSATVCKS